MLANKQHWVFDMDGTLTHAVHDFDSIRADLGLPPGTMILEVIASLPPHEARAVNDRLFDIELGLARAATARPGARALLERLRDSGRKLGILTRNSEELAAITLEACELGDFFAPQDIVGRERCPPKPHPAGIRLLMERWDAAPDDTVVVGDYLFDLQVGRSAGATTVHLDVDGRFPWPEHTDVRVAALTELVERV